MARPQIAPAPVPRRCASAPAGGHLHDALAIYAHQGADVRTRQIPVIGGRVANGKMPGAGPGSIMPEAILEKVLRHRDRLPRRGQAPVRHPAQQRCGQPSGSTPSDDSWPGMDRRRQLVVPRAQWGAVQQGPRANHLASTKALCASAQTAKRWPVHDRRCRQLGRPGRGAVRGQGASS